MIRLAFLMHVHPDRHAEYRDRHNPIWPELEAVLKDHGVRNYSIFLDPVRHLLFAYAEIESEERWAALASNEICRRWQAHMADVMPSRPDHSLISEPLAEVFHLD